MAHTSIITTAILLLLLLIVSYAAFYYTSIQSKQSKQSIQSIGALKENFISNVFADRSTVKSNAVKAVTDLVNSFGDSTNRKPMLANLPDIKNILINYEVLGCRYPGYLGNGAFDSDIGIQLAVKAGCRAFVLDIDYSDDCVTDNTYIPRIVVRDKQGKLLMYSDAQNPLCTKSIEQNSIRAICHTINFYAFSDSSLNRTDPLIIILYFLRKPPGSNSSKIVLDYYSYVAKCVYEPFKDRLLTQDLDGGVYNRQKQEGMLLRNTISMYNEKVLIFSNANTDGFREPNLSYYAVDDLDYLINLRLSYNEKKLGITEKLSSNINCIIDVSDSYMNIGNDQQESTVNTVKQQWTICLASDPLKNVTNADYKKIRQTYGINCTPILLFNEESANVDIKYMFPDDLFKQYSFIPRYNTATNTNLLIEKAAVVIPAPPPRNLNANAGIIRSPSATAQ